MHLWEDMVPNSNQANKFGHFTLSSSEVQNQYIIEVLKYRVEGGSGQSIERKWVGFSLVGAGMRTQFGVHKLIS